MKAETPVRLVRSWDEDPARIRRRMRRWRPRRAIWAYRSGVFWLPCPTCGEPFSGHEWVGRFTVKQPDRSGRGVCPACEVDIGQMGAVLCREHCHDWTQAE